MQWNSNDRPVAHRWNGMGMSALIDQSTAAVALVRKQQIADESADAAVQRARYIKEGAETLACLLSTCVHQ